MRISDWSSDVCSSDLAYTRIVRPVAGSPRIRMNLSPMRDHGAERAPTTRGTNHIHYLVGNQPLRLTTDAPVGYPMQELVFRVESDLHFRSEEHRVGNECVRTCKSRWSPSHKKK